MTTRGLRRWHTRRMPAGPMMSTCRVPERVNHSAVASLVRHGKARTRPGCRTGRCSLRSATVAGFRNRTQWPSAPAAACSQTGTDKYCRAVAFGKAGDAGAAVVPLGVMPRFISRFDLIRQFEAESEMLRPEFEKTPPTREMH